MVLNKANEFSKFIGFHPDVELIRNVHVKDEEAVKFDVNAESIVFKLKNDKDIFVLSPFLNDEIDSAIINRIKTAKNHLWIDDLDDWIDDFTITSTEWVGFVDDITDNKLCPFLNDLKKFFNGDDDFIDINKVKHNIKVDFKTPSFD